LAVPSRIGFPRYYRYFATSVFNYRGQSIRNHNRLLGNVEGVDGIKTGYTRASGFNLVSSMRRGNRHLVGVVLGGRSGGSRDAIMRKPAGRKSRKGRDQRTVAAITERGPADGAVDMAEAETASWPVETAAVNGATTAAEPALAALPATRSIAPAKPSLMAQPPLPCLLRGQGRAEQIRAASQARACAVDQRRHPDPADFRDPGLGRADEAGQGQDGSGQGRANETGVCRPSQPAAPPVTSTIPARPEVAETSSAVVANTAEAKAEAAREALRAAMPQQPAGHGTGNGVLGVLPASSLAPAHTSHAQTLAYADPAPRAQPQAAQQNDAVKPAAPAVVRTGWIVQVGALESESEAKQRIDLARTKASALLSKADPFTETIVSKDNRTLYRARFAGLDRDSAEAVCRTLKRADISCMTVRN
jgi:D-alanyl-D-alanine carboxypeptidase